MGYNNHTKSNTNNHKEEIKNDYRRIQTGKK
nr:MAG TPA: hypothetical protein [Caudoviricetes sp.]